MLHHGFFSPQVLCYITFFQMFGTFVLLAILYSTVFSFGFMMAMLTTLGPMGTTNDFVEIGGWAKGKLAGLLQCGK